MRFAELRHEYDTEVVGRLIYGIVLELSGRVCRSYRESVYNNGLRWDEQAVEDLAQEVILKELLDAGQLEYIFNSAETTESVRRLVTKYIKRTLTKRRMKTPIDRLITRIAKLAETGDIDRTGESPAIYRPTGSTADWQPLTRQQIVVTADAASHVPVLFTRLDTNRQSQIYTRTTLLQALAAFFSVSAAIAESELRQILEIRLTPWNPAVLVPIEEPSTAGYEPMPDIEIDELGELVRDWIEGLTINECWVFYFTSRGKPNRVAAQHLGFRSRTSVINIRKDVLEGAERLLRDIDPQRHVDALGLAQEFCAQRLSEEP